MNHLSDPREQSQVIAGRTRESICIICGLPISQKYRAGYGWSLWWAIGNGTECIDEQNNQT